MVRPHIAHGALASEVKTFELPLPDVVQHTIGAQYHGPSGICHIQGAVILSHGYLYLDAAF